MNPVIRRWAGWLGLVAAVGMWAQEPAPAPADAPDPATPPAAVLVEPTKPSPDGAAPGADAPGDGTAAEAAGVFEAARRAFDAGLYPRAATEFAAFVERFPESVLRDEAGELARFAAAEASLAAGRHEEAARAFRDLRAARPESARALAMLLREASAWLLLGRPDEVRSLLGGAGNPLEGPAGEAQLPEWRREAWLVRGRAELAAGDPASALASARVAEGLAGSAPERWPALVLRVESALARDEAAAAVEAAGELRQLADDPALADRRPEAVAMLGRALLQAGDAARAATVLAANAAAEVPVGFRREAVLQLATLDLEADNPARARDRLAAFVAANPSDPGLPRFRLLLGQSLFLLYRRAHAGTNTAPEVMGLLTLALQELDAGLGQSPEAGLAARLQLTRGWAIWEEALAGGNAERLAAAGEAFAAATAGLPHSVEQAVARFKQGDVALARRQPADAVPHYLAVVEGYTDLPAVESGLAGPAWRQLAQAAVASTNAAVATRAVGELLRRSPTAEVGSEAALLVGQSLMRTGDPASARELLTLFLEKVPESPARPQVRLALANSWMLEQRWDRALPVLDDWLRDHAQDPLAQKVEFDRAWVTAMSGRMTNAVERFRLLADRYATNPLARTAQLWLGDHFFNQGDYARSEQAFVSILTNSLWTGSAATFRARLLAGEAALRGGRLDNAREHYLRLLNDKATPDEILPSAYFGLGNVYMQQAPPPAGNPFGGFQLAIEAFARVTQFTNSPLLVAALGRLGDCHLQLGATNALSYDRALEFYQRVVAAPEGDVAMRAKARIGMGSASERLAALRSGSASSAALEQALGHYLDIVTGKILRPGEVVDPHWWKEAGLAAGRLMEGQGRFAEAAGLYAQLARDLPVTRPVWEARLDRVRAAAPAGI